MHRRQDGFKAHLAVEPDTGLVTACQLTKAAGPGSHDAEAGIDLLTGEREQVEVLGDSAYATGEALAAMNDTGHTPMVKPWPIKPAVPDGFTIASGSWSQLSSGTRRSAAPTPSSGCSWGSRA